jgi:hypothetical protein
MYFMTAWHFGHICSWTVIAHVLSSLRVTAEAAALAGKVEWNPDAAVGKDVPLTARPLGSARKRSAT